MRGGGWRGEVEDERCVGVPQKKGVRRSAVTLARGLRIDVWVAVAGGRHVVRRVVRVVMHGKAHEVRWARGAGRLHRHRKR